MTNISPERFYIGVAALLAASVLSSLGWVFEGEAVNRLSPVAVVCVSLTLGGISQLAIAYALGQRPTNPISSVSLKHFLAYSIIRTSVLSMLFAYCLTLTSSSKTMFLTKIEPYIVLLIQILFHGHATTRQHLTLLGIHLLGALLLSTGGHFAFSRDLIGDALIFFGVVIHASLYQPSHHYSSQLGPLFASGISQLVGGVVLIPFALLLAQSAFELTPENQVGWWYTLLTVVVFYVASTGLWFYSLRAVPAWLASALRCVGPVVAAPFAWLLFSQRLSLTQVVGALIVVATSAMMVLIEKRGAGAAETESS
jgi:drug/metabolite transporter (DMT)-like permease